MGKENESLKTSPAYGVSAGPEMVAVQASKLLGLSGKAETPGVVESMSCMSSVCRLGGGISGWGHERRVAL